MMKMNLEEYEEYWLALWASEGHRTQMFSLVVTGPAAAILHGKKKTAGNPQTRGNFVSVAVEFYEKNRRSNYHSEIRRLERREIELMQNIEGLQKLLETGN